MVVSVIRETTTQEEAEELLRLAVTQLVMGAKVVTVALAHLVISLALPCITLAEAVAAHIPAHREELVVLA